MSTFRTIARHEEDGLGFPYPVVLIDSAEEELDANGAVTGLSVPDLEGLAASVVIARVMNPWQLAGEEVRAIRHVLGLSGRDMAAAVVMDHTTLSRWENGKQDVGEWADKQVRYAALIALRDRVPGLHVDPTEAIGLRTVPRPPGAWPVIEMRRVHVSAKGEPGIDGWDSPRHAA